MAGRSGWLNPAVGGDYQNAMMALLFDTQGNTKGFHRMQRVGADQQRLVSMCWSGPDFVQRRCTGYFAARDSKNVAVAKFRDDYRVEQRGEVTAA